MADLKLTPQEQAIVDYHRNTIATGRTGRDEAGRPITVYSTGIRVPEGKYAGRFVSVPGFVDGRILSEDEAYAHWKSEIEAGKWPTYKSGEELNRRSQEIHRIMDEEGDGSAGPQGSIPDAMKGLEMLSNWQPGQMIQRPQVGVGAGVPQALGGLGSPQGLPIFGMSPQQAAPQPGAQAPNPYLQPKPQQQAAPQAPTDPGASAMSLSPELLMALSWPGNNEAGQQMAQIPAAARSVLQGLGPAAVLFLQQQMRHKNDQSGE